MLSHIAISFSLCVGWRPLGVSLLALIAILSALKDPKVEFDNHLIIDEVEAASAKTDDKGCRPIPVVESAVYVHAAYLRAGERPVVRKEAPMIFVSAEGGGIRAAYWVAVNLAHRDIATNGEFSKHLASLSGVSGGSLGVATWLAALERQDLTPAGRLDLVTDYLSSDFLSPLIAGLFFLDLPRTFLPLWYASNRVEVFEKSLAARWQQVGETDFFYRRARDLCVQGLPSVPALTLGATDALKGRFFRLPSTFYLPESLNVTRESVRDLTVNMFDGDGDPKTVRSSIDNASVAQAVSISARFPYLTPAAFVGVKEGDDGRTPSRETRADRVDGNWIHIAALVDGGYVDNSALTPTIDGIQFLKKMRSWQNASIYPIYSETPLEILHFSNNPEIACDEPPDGVKQAKRDIRCPSPSSRFPKWVSRLFSPFYVPLQATFAVRRTHVNEMSKRLDAILHDAPLVREDRSESIHLANAMFDTIYLKWPLAETRRDYARLFPSTGVTPEVIENLEQMRKWVEENPQSVDPEFLLGWREMMSEAEKVGTTNSHPLDVIETNVSQLNWVDQWIRSNRPNVDPASLTEWHKVMTAEARRSTCKFEERQFSVPLGWTLTKQHENVIRCLAFRTGLATAARIVPVK